MIERELIFLLGYTAVMSVAVWLTVHFWEKMWNKKDIIQLDSIVIGMLVIFIWVMYFIVEGSLGRTLIHLWMDYLEAHGVFYSSGALK
jgi:hypothetical protein